MVMPCHAQSIISINTVAQMPIIKINQLSKKIEKEKGRKEERKGYPYKRTSYLLVSPSSKIKCIFV